jgi:hypothetical protein
MSFLDDILLEGLREVQFIPENFDAGEENWDGW